MCLENKRLTGSSAILLELKKSAKETFDRDLQQQESLSVLIIIWLFLLDQVLEEWLKRFYYGFISLIWLWWRLWLDSCNNKKGHRTINVHFININRIRRPHLESTITCIQSAPFSHLKLWQSSKNILFIWFWSKKNI